MTWLDMMGAVLLVGLLAVVTTLGMKPMLSRIRFAARCAARRAGREKVQTAIQTTAALAVLGVTGYGVVTAARGQLLWGTTADEAMEALESTTADTTKVISDEAHKTRDVLVALLEETQKLRAAPSFDPIEPCLTPDRPGESRMIPRSECQDRAEDSLSPWRWWARLRPEVVLAEMDRLTVASEVRCSDYDRDDYPQSGEPQSVKPLIVQLLGGMWSPYDGQRFESMRESDIEHIVALSEAHDSGACAWTDERRREFARDLDNLTLATPELNRSRGARDAAEWLPELNRCWFAARVVAVRAEWELSIDQAERDALAAVIRGCKSFELNAPAASN